MSPTAIAKAAKKAASDEFEQLRPILSVRPPPAFTVSQFCRAYSISRSGLYGLWKAGRGPDVTRYGAKIMISAAAANRWWRKQAKAEKPWTPHKRKEQTDAAS